MPCRTTIYVRCRVLRLCSGAVQHHETFEALISTSLVWYVHPYREAEALIDTSKLVLKEPIRHSPKWPTTSENHDLFLFFLLISNLAIAAVLPMAILLLVNLLVFPNTYWL